MKSFSLNDDGGSSSLLFLFYKIRNKIETKFFDLYYEMFMQYTSND